MTPSTNWIPEIDTVTTVTGTANDHGVMVTDLPAIMGQITSEGGYANLTVQYDTDGDYVSNHTEASDQWGRFAWKDTTLSSPTSSGQTLTWNVRAVYTDPTTQTTTVDNWTSYSYIYQDRTVEATLDYATIVRNTDVDNNSVYKITGSISFGNHGVRTHVELDYRGTEVADGIAVPNSDEMFTFYVTPENPTIRMRVVETLTDGTRHYPTQEWHTLSLTPKPYTPGMSLSGTSEDVRLTLVTWGEYLATGVVLRMDGTLGLGQTYSSYRVSVDFDSDDTADIQLIPDEQGRVTQSMIEVAIRSGCKKELPEGLILCPARLTLSGSTTVIAETLMPYIRRGELNDMEYSLCQEQWETFHDSIETESAYVTKEWTEMQTAQPNRLQQLSEEKAVRNAQIAAYYNSTLQTHTNAMNTAMASCCDSGCNGNTHSAACQESRILVQQAYTFIHNDLLYDCEWKYADVNAWYTLERFNIMADSVSKMISFRTNFEKDKADRQLVISRQLAAAGKMYQLAVANALKTSLTAIATQTQTYRNATTAAWSTAASGTYSAATSVLNTWAQKLGTDSDWASYVLDIVEIRPLKRIVLFLHIRPRQPRMQ